MNSFNRQNLPGLKIDMQNALNEVAKKHGLASITVNPGGSFTETTFDLKIQARTIAQSVDPNFIQHQKSIAAMYNLPENTVGRRFTSNGQHFEVVKIDTKKPKFPIIANLVVENKITTKGYKFTVPRIKQLFEQFGA